MLPIARDPHPAPAHEVRVVDGRFCRAECSCGWQGAGRRNRATARAEAHDHALLYADATHLVRETVSRVLVAEAPASADA